MTRKFVILFISVVLSASSFAHTRLILFGGGGYPPLAMARFNQWALGEKQSKILVCTWASEEPQAAYQRIVDALSPHKPGIMKMLRTPDGKNTAEVLSEFKEATGVFFTGGDQNKIMDIVEKYPELLLEIRTSFAAGKVFAGTSAGTAVMASTMITGEGDFTVINPKSVLTRAGLGLLRGILVDQHFIKRQRQNRLFSLLLAGKEQLALGVDEEAAVGLSNNRYLENFGPSFATLFVATPKKNRWLTELIETGAKIDLKRRIWFQK